MTTVQSNETIICLVLRLQLANDSSFYFYIFSFIYDALSILLNGDPWPTTWKKNNHWLSFALAEQNGVTK